MTAPARLEFEGTHRFEIRRRLGAGGMGVVYEAWDRERGALVALKTLATVDAAGIYRLKKEFRSLADTSHPNLVVLHELVSTGDQWFFTMDLLDGVDFLTWVRGGTSPRSAATVEMTPPDSGSTAIDVSGVRVSSGFDEARLRAAMAQLARGVRVLHHAGKLHRDLKPSNVMVSPEGHVTVLDFGLVSEGGDGVDLYRSIDDSVMGTPAYMAPEQAEGRPATVASDWYAVGAVLYEALTGVLPFAGSLVHVLAMKQLRDPPAPQQIAKDVPEDLAALEMELLRREPGERPSGDEVLGRLAGSVSRATQISRSRRPASRDVATLVGRDAELSLLAHALGKTREGAPATVGVTGVSGLGKSALVSCFLGHLRREGSTVVLAGRCYEHEWVPFKALDSAIDALSRYLRSLPDAEAASLLPRDVHALTRLFPVLVRVRAIADAPAPPAPILDVQELRRRAFAALKELLARIADRHPLVVFVDDLQWGDADSAALVTELLRPPDAPAVLCVGAWRSEQEESALIAGLREAQPAGGRHRIDLAPLAERDTVEVVRQMFAGAGLDDGGAAAAIAREADGSPFFAGELARHSIEQRLSGEPVVTVRLADVLDRRLERLPESARRLLEVVAVAGGPIETTVAVRAAKLDRAAPAALVALRASSLLRGRKELLETYHDRVREHVVAALGEQELRAVHRRIARALMAAAEPDPEALALHLEGAGEREAAGGFARAAASHAVQLLAFDRAVRLYRHALSLRPDDAPERWEIQAALAEALAHAGRSAEAAEAYLDAAQGAGDEAFDLRRRAVEHLLRSGRIDRGLALTEEILSEVGLRFPKTPRRALVSLIYHRGVRKLRGLGFAERDEANVPVEERRRADVTWTMAVGLGMVDPIRGADFQARHLEHALRAGDPFRVARAIALESAHVASSGALDRAAELLARAEALGKGLDDPHIDGFVEAMQCVCAFFAGRWQKCFEAGERADAIFRDRCTNVAWERATIMRFTHVSLFYMGRLGELARRVPEEVDIAHEHDDLFARACAGSGFAVVAWLARGDVAAAETNLRELEEQWSSQSYQLQHLMALQGWTHVDIYAGRAARAWERIQDRWPALERSLILRAPMLRSITRAERIACAIAAGTPDALDTAARDARRLAAEKLPWATAMSTLLRAGIANRRGDRPAAVDLLARAARALDPQDATLFAAAARLHQASLLPPAEAEPLRAQALAAFRAESVADPEALAHLFSPGFR